MDIEEKIDRILHKLDKRNPKEARKAESYIRVLNDSLTTGGADELDWEFVDMEDEEE